MQTRTQLSARLLFTILFCTIGLTSFAQNYRPGYVIMPDGDSLQGRISYFQANKPEPRLYFIPENRGFNRVIEYRSGEVDYFGFEEGGLFQSYKREDGNHFLEVRMVGPMTVLNTFGYYILKEDGQGEDVLFFKKKKIRTNNRNYFLNPFQNNQYLLSSWMNNCNEISEARNKVVSSETLLRWAETYNQCLGEEYTLHETEKTGFKLDIGGLFGGYAGNLNNKFLGDVALGNTSHSIAGTLQAWSLELHYTWLSEGAYIRMSGENYSYSIAGEGTFSNDIDGMTLHVANIDMNILTNRYTIGYDIPVRRGSGLFISPEASLSVNIPVEEISYEIFSIDNNNEVVRTSVRNRDYRISSAFLGYSTGARLKKELFGWINVYALAQFRSSQGVISRYRTLDVLPENSRENSLFVGAGVSVRVIQ